MGRIERLAESLHPHRTLLLTLGLAGMSLGLMPLVAVVYGVVGVARWQAWVYAASVPVVLWALGLAVLATFFHPSEGLAGSRNRDWISAQPWVQVVVRAYASVTVGAFGVSPAVVLASAVV